MAGDQSHVSFFPRSLATVFFIDSPCRGAPSCFLEVSFKQLSGSRTQHKGSRQSCFGGNNVTTVEEQQFKYLLTDTSWSTCTPQQEIFSVADEAGIRRFCRPDILQLKVRDALKPGATLLLRPKEIPDCRDLRYPRASVRTRSNNKSANLPCTVRAGEGVPADGKGVVIWFK